MARERKPLIEPGSVLPATDTLSRILERDRTASGRKAPAPLSNAQGEQPVSETSAEPPATQQAAVPASGAGTPSLPGGDITSNITAHTRTQAERGEYSHQGAQAEAMSDANADAKPATQPRIHKSSKADAGDAVREAVKRQAQRMAASRAIPITLRLPEELNDWLDEYAHSHRKQGVKKQDLVARAVQLLVVELSADGPEGDGDAA